MKDAKDAPNSHALCPERTEEPLSKVEAERVTEVLQRIVPEAVQVAIRNERYSGPIPPPSQFAGFEKALPGSADRILTMAEKEAEVARACKSRLVESQCRDSRLGLWLGFSIGMAALIGSTCVAIFASPTAGTLLGITSIASLVGVFVYGSKASQREEP